MLTDYLYSVWFRDNSAEPDDPDIEWVACIEIQAESSSDAQVWGDHLARGFCLRHPDHLFLSSSVTIDIASNIPRITYGQEATDEVIGW